MNTTQRSSTTMPRKSHWPTPPKTTTEESDQRQHQLPEASHKKYRATCDFCVLSKVKCDKGQPRCTRCIRNKVDCHYSESRRAGRARRLLEANKVTRNEGGSSTGSSEKLDSLNGMSTPPHDPIYSVTIDDYSLDVDIFQPNSLDAVNPTGLHGATVSGPLDGMSTSFCQPSYPESITDLHQHFTAEHLQHVCADYIDQHIGDPNEAFGTSTLSTESRAHSSLNSSSLLAHQDSCMRQACITFNSLHAPMQSCSLSGSDTDRIAIAHGIDDSLLANRTAQDTVLRILACGCADSWYLSFLLVLITHRIMDSYSNLLSRQLSSPRLPVLDASTGLTGAAGSDSINESIGRDPVSGDAQPDVTMNLGGFILQGEAKNKAIAHVVRSQIEAMGSLIEMLAKRYGNSAIDEKSSSPRREFIESLKSLQNRALQLNI